MILYVDLEHDLLRKNPKTREKSLAGRLKVKYRLEEISGDNCLIVRYPRVSPKLLQELGVHAVFVSGCYTDFEHFSAESLEGLRAVYREASWPIFGFCAGLQLMAEAFGARIGPIGALSPTDPDPYEGKGTTGYVPGMLQERGFMPVNLFGYHPILKGLGDESFFYQSHYWEVKSIPEGFQNLARSELSPIQFLAHMEYPLYGTQFHLEEYDDTYPDGRLILENFFQIVNGNK